MAGYEGSMPTILRSDSAQNFVSHAMALRVYSDTIARKYYQLIFPFKCSNQIDMLEYMFYQSSKEAIYIGGPINILKINRDNSITEVRTFNFKKPYKDVTAYCKAFLNNEFTVTYHYKWSKELLTETAKCTIKCDKYY